MVHLFWIAINAVLVVLCLHLAVRRFRQGRKVMSVIFAALIVLLACAAFRHFCLLLFSLNPLN